MMLLMVDNDSYRGDGDC